jgi:hypothetical protein
MAKMANLAHIDLAILLQKVAILQPTLIDTHDQVMLEQYHREVSS